MKKYISTIVISLILLFVTTYVFVTINYAEEIPETKAKKYGVTFPITELGNCTSVSECKTYCEDQTHKDACIVFAKKKGFYKEKEIDTKRQTLLQAAKTELGCNSEESCKTLCQQEVNFEKCRNFAEKNGLDKGSKNPDDKIILEKAKEILGCDSPTSCKTICEQETNKDKCSDFAKQAGLEGGKHRVGPGGCDSEESCKIYCEKNPDECKKFGTDQSSDEKNQTGPGGCNSEESCQKYCIEHPEECKKENKKIEKDNGSEIKKSNQTGPGGCNNEESCKKYCAEHPNECNNIKKLDTKNTVQGNDNSPSEDYCRINPEKCRKIEMKKNQILQKTENNPSKIRRENNKIKNSPEDVKGVSTKISFIMKIINILLDR